MTLFHFLRPAWFLALLPLSGILWLLWRRRLHSRSWQNVCDPELLPHLLLGRSRRRAHWPLWLLTTGMLMAVTALAGPTWKRQPQPLFRKQSALVILFDLSRSMNAADLKPSRLVRARLKVQDILHQRREGQTALVAFAGDAFAVTPLTDDNRTIEALLSSLDPEVMPVQGSEPERALYVGAGLLRRAGMKEGTLLLVTDEDRPQRLEEAARKIHGQGFRLAVLGVGTPEGAPIPSPGGGFFIDNGGNLVLPRLEEDGLRRLARAGGGDFRRISIDDGDFLALLADLESRRLDEAGRDATRLGDRWQEAGIWLLIPLALLSAGAFRRGWLTILAFLLLLPPSHAEAIRWRDLWQRPDQQAHGAFRAGDYKSAGEGFEDPRWKASALYRAGRFAEALKAQPQATGAEDWYNRGNALARSGQLAEAVEAYDQALKINPGDEDARTNRELVEKALKEQEKQQGQQGQNVEQGKEQEGEQEKPQGGEGDQGEDRQTKPDGREGNSESASPENDGSDARPPQAEQANGKQGQGADQSAQDRNEALPDQAREEAGDLKAVEGARAADEKEQKAEKPQEAAAPADPPAKDAEQREIKQWLQRIPDDPGGLLRRKFLYQYRKRGQQLETDRPW